MLGTQQLIIALVLGALFFGAKRLPGVARSLGKSMHELKKAVSGQLEDEPPKPPSPASSLTMPASLACVSRHAALKAEWKHCPRRGVSSDGGESKPSG
jgi:sec-independent protein translocase protein TatA